MGYTHDWTQRRSFKNSEWPEVTADIQAILRDVQHVQGIPLANGAGEPGTSPKFGASDIMFNGVDRDSYETFVVSRKRVKQEWQSTPGRDFCKTARKPYDLAVVACLCYLATVTESHSVSSDGTGTEWLDGLEEARRALPRYANVLDIPRPVMESDRWCPPYINSMTDAYHFGFCVDGKAYIIRNRDGAAYCFPSHHDAAQWAIRHKDTLNASGYFDRARMNSLKRKQDALFGALVRRAASVGRDIQPPAFVRPGEMPPPTQPLYRIEDLVSAVS